MLKYVHNNCHGAKYLFKIDDDTFLNVRQLKRYLLDTSIPERSIMGSIMCNPYAFRHKSSMYYVPEYLYDKKWFHKYISGHVYFMSTAMVMQLLETSMKTSLFPFQGVFLTGLVAERLNISPLNHPMFYPFSKRINDACHHQVIT